MRRHMLEEISELQGEIDLLREERDLAIKDWRDEKRGRRALWRRVNALQDVLAKAVAWWPQPNGTEPDWYAEARSVLESTEPLA